MKAKTVAKPKAVVIPAKTENVEEIRFYPNQHTFNPFNTLRLCINKISYVIFL